MCMFVYQKNILYPIRTEVLKAVIIKISVLWYVMLRSLVGN
jgi:hypothetical protein